MQNTIELLEHPAICQLYSNGRSNNIYPSTEKLLDIALIYLGRKINGETSPEILNAEVNISLEQYATLCGLSKSTRKTNLQKLRGVIKRDIDVLTHTKLIGENTPAFPVFAKAEVSSAGISIVFAQELVCLLSKCGNLITLPTALLKVSNHNQYAYAIGRKLFLQPRFKTVTIEDLIQTCPSMPVPEDLRLTNSYARRRFWEPLSNALDLLCREGLLEWRFNKIDILKNLNGPDILKEKIRYRLHIPQNPLSASESVRITDFERSNKEVIIKDEWGAIDLSFMHRMLEGEFTFESSRIRS